ncbi:Oxidoreductase [Irineochytrium annulatum]|nr:Oxidoreductase [Irineochytrium annulatum]
MALLRHCPPQGAPDPTPGDGEIHIRVKASSVNFADIMARTGMYPEVTLLPAVVGYEVSGIVDTVGPNVDLVSRGRLPGRVQIQTVRHDIFYFFQQQFNDTLRNADEVIIRTIYSVRKPASITFIEAAATPVVYLTAYVLIIRFGGLRKGQTILFQKRVAASVKEITKNKGMGLSIDPVGGDALTTRSSITPPFLVSVVRAAILTFRV